MDARTCRTLRGRRSNMSPIKSPRPRHRCAVRTGTSVERADPNRCWTPLLQETRGRESATIGFAPADVGWAAEARGAQAEGCAGSRLTSAKGAAAAGMGGPCHVASARSRMEPPQPALFLRHRARVRSGERAVRHAARALLRAGEPHPPLDRDD